MRSLVDLARRALRRRMPPLDFRAASRVTVVEGSPGPVDVVIPVHGAAEDFARCLESVHAHTDLSRHRLLVVLDGDGQTQAEALMSALGRDPSARLLLLRHAVREGFVKSVNHAMRESAGDVLLLNSDTLVTAGWLEKLQAAAWSHPAIATATPFSNNATLCSLPQPFEENEIPAGYDVASFARVVEDCSLREYPRLPTGVGVCLYIRRAALTTLGLFDESFGLGYGEEAEFCVRALKAGWAHVLDDATFIFHAGQRSFGASREERVRRATLHLGRRHPEYEPTIADFMREDPLRLARDRVLAALRPRETAARASAERPRVLHVVHGWPPYSPAGTELYAQGLATRQARDREVSAYARIARPEGRLGDVRELMDHGVRVRLVVNDFTQRSPLSRNALRDPAGRAAFARYLDAVHPQVVHVHHLAGHSLDLVTAVADRGLPLVLQIQDWWLLCARSNLLRPDRSLCSGPGLAKCSRCLPLTRRFPSSLWNPLLYAYRRRAARVALARADAVVMGSRFIESSLRDLGLLGPSARVHVIPYGVSLPADASPVPRSAPQGPLRCGFIGSIMPHKGVHVAVDAFRGIDPGEATLDVWGDTGILPEYTREVQAGLPAGAVRFRGRFDEAQKAAIFAGVDLLLVPSLGLESFALVAAEAIACGVPVLASRRGALTEWLAEGQGGAFFEPGSAQELRAGVRRLAADRRQLAEWARARPRVKSTDEHAREIDAIYDEVQASRGRA